MIDTPNSTIGTARRLAPVCQPDFAGRPYKAFFTWGGYPSMDFDFHHVYKGAPGYYRASGAVGFVANQSKGESCRA